MYRLLPDPSFARSLWKGLRAFLFFLVSAIVAAAAGYLEDPHAVQRAFGDVPWVVPIATSFLGGLGIALRDYWKRYPADRYEEVD